MALISGSIPNLVGGVSQQPPALRLATTSERTENAMPSVVSGLLKRPSTEHIASLSLTLPNGAAGYLIERNAAYRYISFIAEGDLKVLDLNTGSFATVNFPDGKAYLAASSPVDTFRFVTFGDYTFIANRNITVGKTAVAEPFNAETRLDPSTRGTIYVAQANANTYYSIYINNVLKAEYLTPKGVDAASSVPDTGVIAGELKTDLEAAGYTVVKTGSTLTITNLAASDIIQLQAGSGDKSLKGFRNKVQSFSDLPPNAPEGLIVTVQGDVDEAGDDYYVVYRKGVWVETVGWNQGEQLDTATMPHVLVRETNGTWTFKKHVWEKRVCGDADSNQSPSFVGVKINDIFVYNARLGFLADENVILSEADKFENFYRTTTTQTLDSERIDIAVLHNNVDILQHAVPYNRDLLLMSNNNQFRLSYQNYLAAKTIQIKYTTSFNVSSRVRPLNMGNSLYFVDDREDYNYTKLFEYFPKENVAADEAEEVTSPVPEYVPSDISFMAGSNRANSVLLSSVNDPTSLYYYRFFWAGERKVQTSWNKWTFADCTKIHWAAFSGSSLYLIIQRPSGMFLESIRFDEDVFDTAENYRILLDRLATATVKTYNPATDYTTITLPYSTTVTPEVISSYGTVSGIRHSVSSLSSTQVRVSGDVTTHTIKVGIPYTLLHEFSTLYPRQAKGQGEVVILDARLQLRYLSLEYHDTAYFKVYLQSPGRDLISVGFSAKTVGDVNEPLGKQAFDSGVYRVPVMARNTNAKIWITNDTPFPSAFGAAEWQGELTLRSRKRM